MKKEILLKDLYALINEHYGEDGENILQDMIEEKEVSLFYTENEPLVELTQAYGVMDIIDGEDGENVLQDFLNPKKDNLYLVFYESSYQFETSFEHYLFSDVNEANKKLLELREDIKYEYEDYDGVNIIQEETPSSFVAYVDGYYSEDHISVSLSEIEVL